MKAIELRAKKWLDHTLLAKGSSGLEDDAESYVERCIARILGSCSDPTKPLAEFIAALTAECSCELDAFDYSCPVHNADRRFP